MEWNEIVDSLKRQDSRQRLDDNFFKRLNDRLTSDDPNFVQNIPICDEIDYRLPFNNAGFSIHYSRIRYIRTLPKAKRILDLGGADRGNHHGALLAMGYPYNFEKLYINDLPLEERHRLYSDGYEVYDKPIEFRGGTIEYRYHSMHDLSQYEGESIDFINSGQSIEHITVDEGRAFLKEAFRVLIPGGDLCVDTPNGILCRIQQDEFIDPDHEVEYTPAQLRELILEAGFTIVEEKGLNWMPETCRTKKFDTAEQAKHFGIFDDMENCYIMCFRAKKL